MLKVTTVKLLSDNYAYLLQDESSGRTAVVDPADHDAIVTALQGAPLDWIMITHRHWDHVAAVASLAEAYGASVAGPAQEEAQLRAEGITVTQRLNHEDNWQLGESKARIIGVAGHTKGHIAYYFAESDALFCGDSLFSLGCGKLFEGDGEDLWRTMRRLRALPDETLVYCGHEYTHANGVFALQLDGENESLQKRMEEVKRLQEQGKATIPSLLKDEKACNPYLRCDDESFKAHLGMANEDSAAVAAYIRRCKDQS